MTSEEISFLGVARFNEDGELICFCYEKDLKQGLCTCREKYDCPLANISVSPIEGSKPSDTFSQTIQATNKRLEKSASKIKKGLVELEQAIRKNSRFKL